jgi:hypothetical protein
MSCTQSLNYQLSDYLTWPLSYQLTNKLLLRDVACVCSACRVQELPLHPHPHPSQHPSQHPATCWPSMVSVVARVATAQSLGAAATMHHSALTDVHQDLPASVRTSGTGRCAESWKFLFVFRPQQEKSKL